MNNNTAVLATSAVMVGVLAYAALKQRKAHAKTGRAPPAEAQRVAATKLYLYNHSGKDQVGSMLPPFYNGDPKVGCCPPGQYPGYREVFHMKQWGCWRKAAMTKMTIAPASPLNYSVGCAVDYYAADLKTLSPARQQQ